MPMPHIARSGSGARQDLGPNTQGGPKSATRRDDRVAGPESIARVESGERAIVYAVIVEEDRSAANHQDCAAVRGDRRLEFRDRPVEERRPTRGDDQSLVGPDPRAHIAQRRYRQREERRDRRVGFFLRRLDGRAFVGRDAGQYEPSAASQRRLDDGLRIGERARSSPPSADFDQHAQLRQFVVAAPRPRERLDRLDGVGEDIEFGFRPRGGQRGQPLGAASAADLVGEYRGG